MSVLSVARRGQKLLLSLRRVPLFAKTCEVRLFVAPPVVPKLVELLLVSFEEIIGCGGLAATSLAVVVCGWNIFWVG